MLINTGARAAEPKQDQPPVAISSDYVPPEREAPAELVDLTDTKLKVYPDVVQGSEQWHAQRRGLLTASVVGGLLTAKLAPSKGDTALTLTRLLAAERITGYTEPTAMSRSMERGNMDEPYARIEYAEQYEPVSQVGFMTRQFDGFFIGYSPDGLVGDDGLIEIKSREQKIQLKTILLDQVPSENMAQIQCGLLVSGRKWCDYVSYCGGMPIWVERVYPNAEWQQAIIAAAILFEANVHQMITNYEVATHGKPISERIDHFGDEEIQ